MCLLFHVTIIISLYFMLLLIVILFYSALYYTRLLRVLNKIFNIQYFCSVFHH